MKMARSKKWRFSLARNIVDATWCTTRGWWDCTAFQRDSDPEEKRNMQSTISYICGVVPIVRYSTNPKWQPSERYFIAEKETHHEEKGNFFKLRDNEDVVDRILDAFQVSGPNRHIINGHVPVHVLNGENPIKANGKLMVIDGGFSQAYHKETGISGYTLVYHSEDSNSSSTNSSPVPWCDSKGGTDIKSTTQIVERCRPIECWWLILTKELNWRSKLMTGRIALCLPAWIHQGKRIQQKKE